MLKAATQRTRERAMPKQKTPVRVVSAAAAASVLTVTFDQPVILKGVPAYDVDVVGVTRASAAMTNPTTLAITYSGAVAAATEVTIPFVAAAESVVPGPVGAPSEFSPICTVTGESSVASIVASNSATLNVASFTRMTDGSSPAMLIARSNVSVIDVPSTYDAPTSTSAAGAGG